MTTSRVTHSKPALYPTNLGTKADLWQKLKFHAVISRICRKTNEV